MKTKHSSFNAEEVLHELKHFLPAQAPLKDFIHHNTLHAFQTSTFFKGIRNASEILGYKVSLSLTEFRTLYANHRVSDVVLNRVITNRNGGASLKTWREKVLQKAYDNPSPARIGSLRSNWKRQYHIDLDSLVHPILFRILCSYLDQGISIWNFPVKDQRFLSALREMEQHSFSSFFRKTRARTLLLNKALTVTDLLQILVDDESIYKTYLFDQQFAHQGWSGMISAIEDQPQTLLAQRNLSFHDLVFFELLLEIDALDAQFGEIWSPLGVKLTDRPIDLFADVPETELNEVLAIWQEAFEWTYYDEVLTGLAMNRKERKAPTNKSFQAMFCIDDRETSLRDYLERTDINCETYATPGFFTAEFYFQPEHVKFYTKLCPAPLTPKYLIKESNNKERREKDVHFSKHSHSFYSGWLISQTIGFWSAVKLFINIFRPAMSPASASSFRHMDKTSGLTIENKNTNDRENDLQVGFTIDEMANRVESLLKSIGLVDNFAPLVYAVGHGSSSVNNPHYAAYDCGACSGRPGSVNSRTFSYMANHPIVREILCTRGIVIPAETQFIGALHDTTRDEIAFYDEQSLSSYNSKNHIKNQATFATALDSNSKERSRRFASIDTTMSGSAIRQQVQKRSVSLFEPRPELNHATNALCIVGRRSLTKGLFLDRRAFMNSYDYTIDPEGKILLSVMKPVGPVCGGINLEYFFSRVDNQKLGAGTKLPHNVMGLFGVANGIDGDLRPGLPSQMIEVHDPVRLLVVVEHFPEVVLATIKTLPEMYEWYINAWVNLVAINPETHAVSVFKDGAFCPYSTLKKNVDSITDLGTILETHDENLPVYLIS